MKSYILQQLGISRRRDDLTSEGYLELSEDSEGNIVVSVSDGRKVSTVEFSANLGRSKKVVSALVLLRKAIDEDNNKKPL